MVPMVSKLALILARDMADVKGVVLRTFFVPEDSWLAKAGMEAKKQYQSGVDALKERKDKGEEVDLGAMGAPHITIFYMVLAQIKAKATEQAKLVLDEFWAKFVEGKEQAELGAWVKHFSMTVPKGAKSKKMKGQVKLKFHFGEGPMHSGAVQILEAVLTEVKAKEEYGAEPRGPLEREIGKILDKIK